MAIEEGKAAPPFELPDAEGREVSLADFAGRDVVLYFYPRDDTPGCTKEACGFRDAWKELQKRGVVVLGVSPVGPAGPAGFRRGDLIVCVNGRAVASQEEFYTRLWETRLGEPVVVTVRRESGSRVLTVTPADRYRIFRTKERE